MLIELEYRTLSTVRDHSEQTQIEAVAQDRALIVYDGLCIYCSRYTRLLRLRDSVGTVEFLDARSDDPRVAALQALGYDLDDGMIFAWKGQIHHGSDAVHLLAALSSPINFFNKLNALIFSSPPLARLFYPVLKLGRRTTLRLLGYNLIRRPNQDGTS